MRKKRNSITLKGLLGTVLLLLVFAAIVSTIGYNTFTDSMLDQYADGAFRTADAAATLVSADLLDYYLSSGGKSEQYLSDKEDLSNVCNATGSEFIYVIRPDVSDFWHITFIFSTVNTESEFSEFEFGYVRETTNEDYRTKYMALYDGSSRQELVVRDRGYIPSKKHITAMVPLVDSDGHTKGILCVQYQLDVLDQLRTGYLSKVLFALVGILIIVVIFQILYLHRLILSPIKKITVEASRFADENVINPSKLSEQIRNKDEIGILAESIDQMEDQVQSYVENLARATAEKERINTELSLATRIQAGMLPDRFPPFPDRSEFDIYASMDPAKEVGGDFYDFFLIDDDHLGLAIADVSGKGVPAALFMMAAMIILRNNARMGKNPARILEDVNDIICANNKEEMFVSIWIGILEISSGKLIAANAGHEYPAIYRANSQFEIFRDKHGLVVGAMEGVKYKEYEVQMEPGDKIFVYTDGVAEAADPDNNMFGLERLLEALNQDPQAHVDTLLQNVRQSVDEFVKDAQQFDDLTMLCLEYRGKHI